jgi:zinc transport system substrate-binding protein
MQKMNQKISATLCIIFAMLAALLAAAGCIGTGNDDAGKAILVAVTLPPQEEMVREIGGERVGVFVLIPPGSDPHTYEPRPAIVAQAARADIYLTVGTGLFPVEDVLASRLRTMNPDLDVVDSSRGISYLVEQDEPDDDDHAAPGSLVDHAETSGHSHGGPDPHVWLSLRNAAIMAGNIRDALIRADPGYAEVYHANHDRYTARIRDLDQNITAAFSRDNPGIILVTHPAWGYFARDYGFSVVSIGQEGKEPTAKDLESLILLARDHGIRVVFAEAQQSTRGAETIAGEIGGTVMVIDPLAPDYLANMEKVAAAFAGA